MQLRRKALQSLVQKVFSALTTFYLTLAFEFAATFYLTGDLTLGFFSGAFLGVPTAGLQLLILRNLSRLASRQSL